jgi:hypothetical protein
MLQIEAKVTAKENNLKAQEADVQQLSLKQQEWKERWLQLMQKEKQIAYLKQQAQHQLQLDFC